MKKRLPSRPNLEQLKKQAKALFKGHHVSSPQALRQIQEHHPRWRYASENDIKSTKFTLGDAQRVIACEYGFANWSKLKSHVLLHQSDAPSDAAVRALRDAAAKGDLAQVTELLNAHPDLINERGGPGTRTALHDAAANGRDPVVQLLLERGADPNIRCEGDNAMPLHFAAEKQHFTTIRLLIEHGADPIGDDDYHELDIIGWATSWDYITANKEIVDYLVTHGAEHNIFSAVSMGEVQIIRKLMAESRANLEKRMDLANRRRRPLHLAVMKKQRESLATLLDLGANTEALDEAGFTALDQAALIGETGISQLLLDAGAEVRLPAAIALQRTRDIEELLRRDPDCLKPGKRWGNLIVRASERAPGHVIESLIRAGASVNVRDDPKTAVDSTSGYTPLHAAGFFGNASAAAVLVKHGANVRVRDEKYRGTPAGWANYAGHGEVRDLILEGPIDLFEAIDRDLPHRIPGILAREPQELERPLSDYDPAGAQARYTPLAWAVLTGKPESVRVLLDHGADVTVRAPDNRTLFDLAQESENQQVADLLNQATRRQ
ncbi:MAG: ankyrin repeat domain-containing protein [Acidobacteriaceae bacterium]|nr:ankyrin repeat domain-containing protein [Acidobacteriaceae bacterium]MBV9501270.1 ankyrin repeat domain-containing protein [Acidobacteriaceae bacterium]